MGWFLRLWRLAAMVRDVQVELERLLREVESGDEWFGGFAECWMRDLEEVDELLEEAKMIISRVAGEIEKGRRVR